jgi:hypothetical protein
VGLDTSASGGIHAYIKRHVKSKFKIQNKPNKLNVVSYKYQAQSMQSIHVLSNTWKAFKTTSEFKSYFISYSFMVRTNTPTHLFSHNEKKTGADR